MEDIGSIEFTNTMCETLKEEICFPIFQICMQRDNSRRLHYYISESDRELLKKVLSKKKKEKHEIFMRLA